MKAIKRDIYLNRLIAGIGNGLVKIVTGIRRCGKSYLLFTLFREYLVKHGTDDSHIIGIALDDVLNEEFLNPRTLLMHIHTVGSCHA